MQEAIERFIQEGPIPPESELNSEEKVDHYMSLLNHIQIPISKSEAKALLPHFGPDHGYDLNWELMRIIESPSLEEWPIDERLTYLEHLSSIARAQQVESNWYELMTIRLMNYKKSHE